MSTRPITKRVEKCDICGCDLHGKTFVDGKTRNGPWANMCKGCYDTYGVGLGIGLGQQYGPDGVKVSG